MVNWGGPQFDSIEWKRESKTGKRRIVDISADTKRRLALAQAWNPDNDGKMMADRPMLCYRQSKISTQRTVRNYLKRLAKEFGVDHHSFGVKTLRKTYARRKYDLLRAQGYDAGEAAMILQKDLNHSGLLITQRYLGLETAKFHAADVTQHI